MPPQTDSIMRVTARDLFMALMLFDKVPTTTLDNVRIRLCVDRKRKRRGDYLWSMARDAASELRKLGMLTGGPFPRDRRQYASMQQNALQVTDKGNELIATFRKNAGEAYDRLFAEMYQEHPYLRAFVDVITNRPVHAPVLTSLKEHVSPHYSSATVLADDVSNGTFETDSLLKSLQKRLERELTREEKGWIAQEIDSLVTDSGVSAEGEDATEFAKKFLLKLNDIVIPGVFKANGLGFDYRTHRTLWSLGQEFRLWWTTTSHPGYEVTLVFRTAIIRPSNDHLSIIELEFDSGRENTGVNFLSKLYAAYQKLRQYKDSSYASAWELRSVFCFENRCQPSVFNKLFADHYTGSDEYKLHVEIQRMKPRHEDPIVAGRRRIGSIRMTHR